MSQDQIEQATREISAIWGRLPMSKLDRLLVLTIAMATVMDGAFQDVPGDEVGLRVGRRTLHAFPEALTQFLHIWQPGNMQVASRTLFSALTSKLAEDIKNAPELRRSLHRS